MRKMKVGYIYGLFCICGCEKSGEVRYIGQTIQRLTDRLTNHRGHARFGTKTPVYNWIRKHSPENIKVREVERVPLPQLNDREVWWIENTPGLLNLSKGGNIGDSLRGGKRPDVSENMKGSNHHATTLSEDDVKEIRRKFTGERGQVSDLAKEYGTAIATMSDIIRGVSWKHVPAASLPKTKKRVRLQESDVREIRRRRDSGETLAKIAEDYNTSETNIMLIAKRKTWKHVK